MEQEFTSLDIATQERPSSLGRPIDEAFFRTTTTADYKRNNPRSSPAEIALEAEREAEAARRIRGEYAETQARELLIQQREQAQRAEIQRRISSIDIAQGQAIPTPIDPPTAIEPVPSGQVDLQQFLTRQPRPSTARPPSIDRPAPVPYNQVDLQQNMTQQPRPRSAELPATPNTSGAAVDNSITARPSSAVPRNATPPNNPAINARPSNLPEPAGISPKGLYGGIIVGTAFRIISGQSVDQAVFGASGETIGSVAGAALGTVAGPLGTFVGGVVGGLVGGAIADFIYGQVHPKKAKLPSDPILAPPPFTGGQSPGVQYSLALKMPALGPDVFYFGGTPEGNPNVTYGGQVYGPVGGAFYLPETFSPHQFRTGINATNSSGTPQEFLAANGGMVPRENWTVTIVKVTRLDGQPDTGGNTTSPPLPKDTRTPSSTAHPLNQAAVIPSAQPAAGNPEVENRTINASGLNNYVPGGTASKSNGTPRGDSPDWVPHGGLKGTPHPDNMPQPLLSPLPDIQAQQLPLPFADPEDFAFPSSGSQPQNGEFSIPNPLPKSDPDGKPILLSFPSGAPVTTNLPDGTTLISPTNPLKEPRAVAPASIPTVGKANPVPNSNKPKPTTNPPGTGTDPPTTPETQKEVQDDLKKRIDELGLGLVAITTLLQGLKIPVNNIAQNTTPEAIGKAVTPAVCSTTEPGGCTTNAINNGVNKGNEDLKNWLKNNGLDAADLVLNKDTNTRVRNIENRTGSNEYPIILPEYLLDDYLDKQVTINNQVQFNVWLLKQLDALVGLFPIKIERTDENEQKQTLVFENIAEAIAEITGLLANIAFDADTAVNVATRSTAEAVGAKAAALQAGSYLKAIVDYMGFQGQAVSIDVPISCTPGAVGLDGKLQESELKDFLKPSTQKAIGFKNTDPVDQRLTLRRILESGEISRAALFRPLKADASQNSLTGDAITADKKAEKKRIDDLWEAFKLRMEGHTGGTKVDIDDGLQPPEIP